MYKWPLFYKTGKTNVVKHQQNIQICDRRVNEDLDPEVLPYIWVIPCKTHNSPN